MDNNLKKEADKYAWEKYSYGLEYSACKDGFVSGYNFALERIEQKLQQENEKANQAWSDMLSLIGWVK